MVLLAIPLAATTIGTPFITSPFHSNGSAPLVIQHTNWLQGRLNSAYESFFGSGAPNTVAVSDTNRVELGLRFKARSSGTVSAIRFYKGPRNTGTHVGNLWDASGKLLGSVTFTNESARGWQQAALPKAIHLTAGASYVVSYVAPRGHYAADKNYFAASRTTRSMYAFADSEGHNGVYKYGGGFPTSSQNATNYYVDLLYKADVIGRTTGTTAPPTTTAPVTTVATTTTTSTTTTSPPTTPATNPPTTPPTSPPTTKATTTTTAPPTTPPTTAPNNSPAPNSTSCQFSKPVSVAFCDSFDRPMGSALTRSGDLDPEVWGVSRTSTLVNVGQVQLNEWPAATLTGCGLPQLVLPPNDVRVCNGRVFAPVSDEGGQPILALYPKQPFDIAGRTGTVVFDVSADSEGPHAAWPEFWWTDQPVPAPHAGELPAQSSYARNSFGFVIASQCGDIHGSQIGIDSMSVTRNYASASLPMTTSACVTKGTATGALNHFEVRISQDRVEVWGTDAGSTNLKLMATAVNANLTMTRGLIWVENVHYNAGKFDNQADHEFAFDNIGFDGPTPYRDLSFDVPDNKLAGGSLGWMVTSKPLALQTVSVFRRQTPTAALVTFNWNPQDPTVPSVRLNGGPWHDTPWPPGDGGTFAWRTIAVSVPVSEVHDGVNTVEFMGNDTVLANVNVILVAGAPVPAT
jgi:hypothetical protein